ncbi:MAG: hypothetical protein M3R41_08365 [Pseudomonadota bacterium]|nr:hypothetical protein [Pseudomonadota bacterium]
MDLSFSRFDMDAKATVLPSDLAVMMVGVAARQAASPTALAQVRLAVAPAMCAWFAPLHGSFDAAVAAALTRWKEE